MFHWRWLLVVMLILAGCSTVSPADDRLAVDTVTVDVATPNQYTAIVSGYLLDTCTQIDAVEQRHNRDTITLTLVLNQPASIYCPKLFSPFDQFIPLDTAGLPPSLYTVTVGDQSATFTFGPAAE